MVGTNLCWLDGTSDSQGNGRIESERFIAYSCEVWHRTGIKQGCIDVQARFRSEVGLAFSSQLLLGFRMR